MKLNAIALGVSAAVAIVPSAVSAAEFFDGKVTANIFFAQQFQTGIDVDDGSNAILINAQDEDSSSGFNRLRFALQLNAQFTDRISGFIELAEEPNDFGGQGNAFDIKNDLAWIELDATDEISLRIGEVVPTTMNFIRYTDGAVVQSNPLIGNGVNDIITAETGAWLTGGHELQLGKWDYNITVTKPSFFEDFRENAGYNYTARSSLVTKSGLGIGAGFFKSTGDPDCTAGTCTMEGGFSRGGGPLQGDGDPYSFASTQTGARNKHVGLAPGVDAYAWQVDLMYEAELFTVHGFFGQVSDRFSFVAGDLQTDGGAGILSTEDAEYNFWGVFGKIDLRDDWYVAGRWTATSNEADNISNDEKIHRLQVGGGWWPSDSVLFKVEYVYQKEEANSGGGACAFGTGDCDWSGVVLEMSTSL